MANPESTCWTVIRGAAAGDPDDRSRFAACYAGVVRAYLLARWKNSPHLQDVDDAAQEVFVTCFRPDGILARADPTRAGGFRPYLYAAVRNVARRIETRRSRRREQPASGADLDLLPDNDPSLSRLFDRAWATALLREAARRQAANARRQGPAALRRVELLRLRFADGLPIREVARLWQAEPAKLHHEYARARQEFLAALREVVAFHQPGPPAAVDQACADLLALLG